MINLYYYAFIFIRLGHQASEGTNARTNGKRTLAIGRRDASYAKRSGAPHVKLMRLTFQKTFPAVDMTKVTVSRDCRRIVLFNLVRNTGGTDDAEDELVEVRHYAIRTKPAGISRPIKRIVLSSAATSSKVASAPASRALPNLGRVENIAESSRDGCGRPERGTRRPTRRPAGTRRRT